MRPAALDHGYGPTTKLIFALIRVLSERARQDAAKMTFYRPDFYGKLAKTFIQDAMRGTSAWSVGDHELIAAYISRVNESRFCVGAHSATTALANKDKERVMSALPDLDNAAIGRSLRQTLRMLGTLTRDGRVRTTGMHLLLGPAFRLSRFSRCSLWPSLSMSPSGFLILGSSIEIWR
jgi:AhpD family alkylhydroperoxidase